MNHRLTASFVKRYPAGPEIAIEGLELPEGPVVSVLFGPSGAGKTTVLRCFAGLVVPDRGTIKAGERVWFDSQSSVCMPARERRVGYVPQDYALFPHLTVAANVEYGLYGLPPAERRRRADEIMGLLEIGTLARRMPRELSGGQQQRVALARAVAPRPDLLLLDEPLAALDLPTRTRLRQELRAWLTHLGIATLLVTHDRSEALALGDYLVVMHAGRVAQQGTSEAVFRRPVSHAVAEILSVETVVVGRITRRKDGLACVRVGESTVTALDTEAIDSESVFVCIRGEDVLLSRGSEDRSSARNRLQAQVRSLSQEGPLVRVELDCGFPLIALLTRQACEDLELRPGEAVTALVKAPHIHLIPHPR